MSILVASLFVVAIFGLMFFGSQWLVTLEQQKAEEAKLEAEAADETPALQNS